MSRIDDLAEDLIGRCEPGPAGTCRIHHLDRDEDGHCPEWRRAVSEIDDLLEQVRSEAGANRSVIAAHDSERQRALRERDEARADAEALARGRCLDTITDRGDEHWTSTCILPSDHETAHDDGMGARWTDGGHWKPDPCPLAIEDEYGKEHPVEVEEATPA